MFVCFHGPPRIEHPRLRLSAGARLLSTNNESLYAQVPCLPNEAREPIRNQGFVACWNCSNTVVEGAGGGGERPSVIDGNGWPWWYKFESEGLTAGRPHLVEPLFVTGFRIEGVWLKDSPFWTLHPYACEDVVIRGLKITAAPVRGHNTDGIDPDSCSNVLVEDCYVRVGDDAVAIKSGIDFAGRAFDRPSQNMLFRNCTFESKHVSIGSEQSGGVRNVTIEDCTLGGLSDSSPAFAPGIHLKVSLFKFSCIGWRLLRTILAN